MFFHSIPHTSFHTAWPIFNILYISLMLSNFQPTLQFMYFQYLSDLVPLWIFINSSSSILGHYHIFDGCIALACHTFFYLMYLLGVYRFQHISPFHAVQESYWCMCRFIDSRSVEFIRGVFKFLPVSVLSSLLNLEGIAAFADLGISITFTSMHQTNKDLLPVYPAFLAVRVVPLISFAFLDMTRRKSPPSSSFPHTGSTLDFPMFLKLLHFRISFYLSNAASATYPSHFMLLSFSPQHKLFSEQSLPITSIFYVVLL